jgi:hypothetical protein
MHSIVQIKKPSVKLWFTILLLTGITSTFFLNYFFWEENISSFGKETISFLVPPFITVVFSYISLAYYQQTITHTLLRALLLFVMVCLPLLQHSNKKFEYPKKNDPHLYYQAALYMYENHTLCSYDNKIIGLKAGNQYLYQPGYKYYLSAILFFTNGALFRGIAFVNMLFITLAVCIALYAIENIAFLEGRLKLFYQIFFLGITPALTRNMLAGLSEWLAICLIFLSIFLFSKKKYTYTLITLSLIVFIRQYFILAGILSAFIIIRYQSASRTKDTVLFFLTLLLPVYHNLYYANQFRFFADYQSFANQSSAHSINFLYSFMGKPYKWIILQYVGFDPISFQAKNGKFLFLLGMLFIPIALYLLIKIINKLWGKSKFRLGIFLIVALSMILPSISYVGYAYFPRFQMFVYSSLTMFFIFLMQAGTPYLQKRNKEFNNLNKYLSP